MTEDVAANTSVQQEIEGIDFSAPGMTKDVQQNGMECWYKDGKIVVKIYPDKSYAIYNDKEKPIKALQSDGTEVNIEYDKEGNYLCSNSKGEKWVNSPEGVPIYKNDGKGVETWYDDMGRISQEKLASRCTILYYDGRKSSEEWDNGDFIHYYDNGNISEQRKGGRDGKLCKEFYYNGNPKFLLDEDGVKHRWYKSGIKEQEEYPDGSYKEWDEKGNLRWREEVDREGNTLGYDRENKLARKTFTDGTMHYWDGIGEFWNGLGKLREKFTDGTEIEWHPDGSLYCVKIPGVGFGKYYSYSRQLGNEEDRKLNGTSYSCDKIMAGNSEEIVQRYGLRQKSRNKEWRDGNGNIRVYTNCKGETFSYDEKGLITGIQYPDGVRTAFSYDKNGKVHAQKFGKDGKLEHGFEYDVAKRGHNGDIYYCDCWDRLFSEYPDLAPKQTKTDVQAEHEVKSVQEPTINPVETQQSEVKEPAVAPVKTHQAEVQEPVVSSVESQQISQPEQAEDKKINKGPDNDTKAYRDFGEILKDKSLSEEEQMWYLDGLIEEEKQQVASANKIAELRGVGKGKPQASAKPTQLSEKVLRSAISGKEPK